MNKKLINLLLFYLVKLDQLGAKPVEIIETHPDPMRRLSHCMWMITKMRKFDWSSDDIKANRWLGYIQGVLNAERVFSILELRDHTRPLYNDIPECKEVTKLLQERRSVSWSTARTRIDFEDIANDHKKASDTKKYASFYTLFHKGTAARTATEAVFYFKEAVKLGNTTAATDRQKEDYKKLVIEALIQLSNTEFRKLDVDEAKEEIFNLPNHDAQHHMD